MRRILSQAKKELIQLRRDRLALAMPIGLPLVLALLCFAVLLVGISMTRYRSQLA